MGLFVMDLLGPATALLAARFASFVRALLLPSIQHCRQTCRACTCIVYDDLAWTCMQSDGVLGQGEEALDIIHVPHDRREEGSVAKSHLDMQD